MDLLKENRHELPPLRPASVRPFRPGKFQTIPDNFPDNNFSDQPSQINTKQVEASSSEKQKIFKRKRRVPKPQVQTLAKLKQQQPEAFQVNSDLEDDCNYVSRSQGEKIPIRIQSGDKIFEAY